MEGIIQENNIQSNQILKTNQSNIPPWIIKNPNIILSLNKLSKSKTHPTTYIEKFSKIKEKYQNYESIYTDGSKDEEKTGSAAITKETIIKKRLPNEASIFSAEVYAIKLVLNFI